jgi:hypothetical protein
VAVEVVAAQVGRPLLTRGGESKLRTPEGEEYLTVKLELSNRNAEQATQYTGWAARPSDVQLVDNGGQSYEMKSFRTASVIGQQQRAPIEAAGAIQDVLLFHKPDAKATFLRLSLPARAFGEQGTVKFQIPLSMVERDAETAETDGPRDVASAPPSDPDRPGAPGRPLPEVERAIAEMSAEGSAQEKQAKPAGDTQAGTGKEEPKFGPIAIPGLDEGDAKKSSDEKASSFEENEELMEAREKLLRQQAEERERQRKAKSSGQPRRRK